MIPNRKSVRLRVEGLEDRAVPAVLDGIALTSVQAGTASPGEIITLDGTTNPPPVQEADLALTTTVDRLKPSMGDIVSFKLTLANNGPVSAGNVTVAAVLPGGLTFVAAQGGAGTYDSASGTWAVGTLAVGKPATLIVKAKVIDPAAQTLSAAISNSDKGDPKAENNSAAATVSPVLAGLTLTKTVSNPTLTLGAVAVFTITVRNTGPGVARGLVIADTLPAGLTYAKFQAPTLGSYNPNTKKWSIGVLPAGTTATLRVFAVVKKVGRMEAPAVLTATGFDPARSKLDAMSLVTGTKVSTAATWTFTAPPGFKVGPVLPATLAAMQATLAAKGLTMPKLPT